MKSILIAVKPRYARLIEEGYKLEEIRKSVPKGFVGWVYLYETVGKTRKGRGKIIGRWWHDSYQTIRYEVTLPQGYESFDGEWIDYSLYGYWLSDTLLQRSCLTHNDTEELYCLNEHHQKYYEILGNIHEGKRK